MNSARTSTVPAAPHAATPGPWHVDEEPNGFFIYSVPRRIANDPAIAHVYEGHAADAALLAAAPDLLAALQEIADRGPLAGYMSASALRLRLVLTQSIARKAIERASRKGAS